MSPSGEKPFELSPDDQRVLDELCESGFDAEAAKRIIKDRTMPVQAYLIEYLLEDEQKHDNLLEGLGSIKKKMYPYG